MGDSETDALLIELRRALQRRDIDEARAMFLRLPDVEHDAPRWLEHALRDAYTAGLLDIAAVLSFLESLPSWEWTLEGCCVLHRVNTTLQRSALPHTALHTVPTMPLAYFLHKLVSHLDGSVKLRAESYWYDWVSPTMRAIVMGKPLVLSASTRGERLYTPISRFAFDFDRRNVFTWTEAWTPDDRKDQWRFIPANAQRDRFFIQSVQFDEYLYAADYAKFRRDDFGLLRSRVFTWRRLHDSVGESGHWQLIPLEHPNRRDLFALYNPYQKEYLYSPSDIYDNQRRYVFTREHVAKDTTWLQERRWSITPCELSPVERGIEAFFLKQYPEAVDEFTTALEQLPDHTEHVKCYVYRMAANLRMGKSLDVVQADFDQIEAVGSDKAAIFHGLHHLWAEAAAVLSTQAAPPSTELSSSPTSSSLSSSVMIQSIVPITRHLARGDQLFVHKDYEQALAAYQEAACAELQTADSVLRLKQAEARLASAKCHFALGRLDASAAALDEILSSNPAVSWQLEARALLWRAKCERHRRQFDQAMLFLEQALDRIACPQPSSGGSPSSAGDAAWVRHAILTEMRVVGIYRQELFSELLTRCDTASAELGAEREQSTAANSSEQTIQQLLDLFQCPLSLEIMQDPVMTPNGDTYEREMIERHLSVNGHFDPMTRVPLTQAQLSPNRALKRLMETLLSEHRLGLLLASCNT
ncbi:hypothetical protein P43SY_009664 [Pythium insidiosum]|uniref:E3 ubiquitin-protein ligase CHIP n=1 Tax=Pythium insidiosum TaxID=114742 RepID=A0AAD5LWA7_PYTIN|nr:hypothetical protein P43SY_009664 [Pythium insidiosum]